MSLKSDKRQGKFAEVDSKLVSIKSEFKNRVRLPMKRKSISFRRKPFIAYDLETTRISVGTPIVKYLTAFSEDFKLSTRVNATRDNPYSHLGELLEENLLVPKFNHYRFIAWNGNGYDVFFIAMAILLRGDYILRPYLTRSKNLRGLRVTGINSKKGRDFEFLDGMAMTGLDTVKMKLSKFVNLFAPQTEKLELDFSKEEFDADNPEHVAYALRDSEALYYAMKKVNEVSVKLTGAALQPTLGNLAIKYLQSKLPDDVICWPPNDELKEILHGPAKRGGYCWIRKQYKGKVWKYDLNQAYAAAMRDAELPQGSCAPTSDFEKDLPGVYRVRVSRDKKTRVPFYYRDISSNAGLFCDGGEIETWLLSTEVEHLIEDKWNVEILEGHFWEKSFNLKDMVDELERLRFTDPGGPSGPLGIFVKTLGNAAYGKTLEQLEGMELILANTCPEGFGPYMPEIPELEKVFCKEGNPFARPYHCPQIGCFITAHVRIVVRNAALAASDAFLYADTDCVVFSRAVGHLDINATRYGAWKEECAGDEYILIGKKCYWGENGEIVHAKGLHVKNLTKEDYELWQLGTPPSQKQTQRMNFVKFMTGHQMFGEMERRGTDVNKSKQTKLVNGEFVIK